MIGERYECEWLWHTHFTFFMHVICGARTSGLAYSHLACLGCVPRQSERKWECIHQVGEYDLLRLRFCLREADLCC